MEDLLKFLLSSTTKESIEYKKEEDQNNITFILQPPKEKAGLIIGKNGKIIKSITQILKMRAVIEKKRVKTIVETKN